VSVVDTEGRPLVDASVHVFGPGQRSIVGNSSTGANGLATIGAAPAAVLIHVDHPYGVHYLNSQVDVAQEGATFLQVIMQPARPRPTAALLPVSIPADSVSADRSELSLSVTVVASALSPFNPAGYGDYSAKSTPSLGLTLGDLNRRECFVWLDSKRTVPTCGTPWGASPYTVSVELFTYDPVGGVPMLGPPEPARTAMLIMDQSQRVAELDPRARRSYAARWFLARAARSHQQDGLSVIGLAGNGGDGRTALLPEQPLWLPYGTGKAYSSDLSLVLPAVATLEPLAGGAAPVFDALQAAFKRVAAETPPEGRAVVALLGGGDDPSLSDAARAEALAALRQQRDQADIQPVLIVGAPESKRDDRAAIAELAAALHAPMVSLGAPGFYPGHEWASGSYAGMDLAGDLINRVPLPSLSAVFRVKANESGAFPAGATLRGVLSLESNLCAMGCEEFTIDFAVEIP